MVCAEPLQHRAGGRIGRSQFGVMGTGAAVAQPLDAVVLITAPTVLMLLKLRAAYAQRIIVILAHGLFPK